MQLGEVFDFTMFKKKNVWRDCVCVFEWSPGASVWLGLKQGGGLVGVNRQARSHSARNDRGDTPDTLHIDRK